MRWLPFVLVVACGGAVAPSEQSSSGSSGSPPPQNPSSSSGISSGGSGTACSGLGCVDGLTLSFNPSTRWKPGKYVFVINADDRTQYCEGSLPLSKCTNGLTLVCKGNAAMIGESGCALPAEQHGFADIRFLSGPSKVTIRIVRDGLAIVDEALAPVYQTTQPNGPACGPVCRQAQATLTIKDP